MAIIGKLHGGEWNAEIFRLEERLADDSLFYGLAR
jgi:hypothetical protein